jgi:hypothetical protein
MFDDATKLRRVRRGRAPDALLFRTRGNTATGGDLMRGQAFGGMSLWSRRHVGRLLAMLAFAAALAPATALAAGLPKSLRTEWQRARSQCGGDQEDALRISRKQLDFYEATFVPRKIHVLTPHAVSLVGIWSEDGEDHHITLRLDLSRDGQQLVVKSPWWSSRLVRCS